MIGLMMRQKVLRMGLVLLGLCLGQAQAGQTQTGKTVLVQSPATPAPATAPPTFSCASQGVLENLVALIVKSNQLDPTLNFLVSQVKTDPSQETNKKTSEKAISCTVHLQIVRSQSEELVDELDVAYRITNQQNGAFRLEFSPLRQGSK